MKPVRLSVLLVCFILLTSCRWGEPDVDEFGNPINPIVAASSDRDLEEIQKDGVLRALIVYSSTSYFLYRGQPMGFEYELIKWLAEDLNLKLELIVSEDLDTQFEVLNRGDVDIIAQGMTVTNQRKWEVDFTEYLYLTKQVLVQKKPDNYLKLSWKSLENALIDDAIELINDTVSIRRNSSYYERIQSLSNEIGGDIYIDTLSSKLSDGEIMDLVAKGEIKYTIVDENVAKINASNLPILDIDVPISYSQRIAWVTRKKAKNLTKIVNEWILKNRKKKRYNVIYNKYFKNKYSYKKRERSDYYSLKNNQISKYDNLIKKYAQKINWDWRLLAALIFQESHFDPKANSWAGAKGLMQVMPRTAEELNIKDLSDPKESIRGGTTYLKQMYNQFESIPDSITRIKFAMAAYNCGLGHVIDAQRLAEENKLNPYEWDNNVDKMLLALRFPANFNKPFIKFGYVRGTEPVNYVNEIFQRYEQYQQFIKLEDETD
jgi:membrane-bound lytic murein transglycosylase F